MRGKSTLSLVVLALALGAFIYFYERHTLDTGGQAERVAKLLPDFNPLAVQAVAVSGTNLNLRAERSARGWRLTAPVAYPAHAPGIGSSSANSANSTRASASPPPTCARNPTASPLTACACPPAPSCWK